MGLRSGFQDRGMLSIGLYWFLALAQVAIAITILVIIADELWHYTAYAWYGPYYVYYSAAYGACMFRTDWLGDSTWPCWYFYLVAGVSIVASVCMACAIAATVDQYDRSCSSCRVLLSVFMWCWWAAGASVMTAQATYADNANAPHSYWRHVVVGLAWGELLAFTLTLLIDIKVTAAPARPRYPPIPPVAPVKDYGVAGATKQTELPTV